MGAGTSFAFLTIQHDWLHKELGDVLQRSGSAPR